MRIYLWVDNEQTRMYTGNNLSYLSVQVMIYTHAHMLSGALGVWDSPLLQGPCVSESLLG